MDKGRLYRALSTAGAFNPGRGYSARSGIFRTTCYCEGEGEGSSDEFSKGYNEHVGANNIRRICCTKRWIWRWTKVYDKWVPWCSYHLHPESWPICLDPAVDKIVTDAFKFASGWFLLLMLWSANIRLWLVVVPSLRHYIFLLRTSQWTVGLFESFEVKLCYRKL